MSGKNIRRVRQEKGVTQWQLSQAVGVTTGKLLLIERGEQECPPELLKAIANALKVDVNEIGR